MLRRFVQASCLLALLGMCACEGIAPGDYIVYRIAFQPATVSEGCQGSVPFEDTANDTSSLYTNAVFILYVGPDEKYFLDTGVATLSGSRNGDTFQFDGSDHDETVQGMDADETTFVSDEQISVSLAVDGKVVTGSFTRRTDSSCEGTMCPDPATTQCVEEVEFVGGEVSDVELEHEI